MNASTARKSALAKLAALLSVGSLIWTTWSLFDLLGAGPAGITVAVCADAVWGAVIYAEYRGVRLAGRRWPVALFGWAALIAVVAFLVWHGFAANNLAMAFAGPFLPLGAKVVWALALADLRDPAALSDAEKATLAKMERGLVFEEAQHAIEMRRRTMRAELLMAEVSTDFDIEVMRQDRARDLRRRAPLALTTGPVPDSPDTPQDTRPDASGHPDMDRDTGHADRAPSSKDTRPDTPDAIRLLASAASGPADLVRTLSAHGVPQPHLVSEAIRLRPDMNPDSIRRTAKRLGEGPYL